MPTAILDDRSHIALDGEEAEHFLHNLVTTDIIGLPIGEARPGALLTAQGKVLFSFLVFRSASGFVLDVLSRDAADFFKRLKFFRLRAKVNIAEPQPVSVQIVWDDAKPGEDFLRDARFKTIDVWRGTGTDLSNGAEAVWTSLRIDHGVAEPYADFAYGDVFPHDIGLDQTAGLSFSKGCYVGQEVVSRMHHRATARWRLMVVEGAVLVSGAEITADGKPAGQLGSVMGGKGLASVRLVRIKDALDKNAPIAANEVPVSFRFPAGVSYDWPTSADGA